MGDFISFQISSSSITLYLLKLSSQVNTIHNNKHLVFETRVPYIHIIKSQVLSIHIYISDQRYTICCIGTRHLRPVNKSINIYLIKN